MDWKEFLRPKIITALISIIITIIMAVIIINLPGPRTCPAFCPDPNLGSTPSLDECPQWPNLLKSCCDRCRSFQGFIGEVILVFVLPFALIYLITSLIYYFIKK